MLKKKRQIKFYCTEDQFKGLQLLKVTRNRTTQDLMTEALLDICMSETTLDIVSDPSHGELWKNLSDQLYSLRTRGGTIDLPPSSDEVDTDDSHPYVYYPAGHPLENQGYGFHAKERDLWLRCLIELPDSTIRAFSQLMQDSLRFFSSSRLKARKMHDLD